MYVCKQTRVYQNITRLHGTGGDGHVDFEKLKKKLYKILTGERRILFVKSLYGSLPKFTKFQKRARKKRKTYFVPLARHNMFLRICTRSVA